MTMENLMDSLEVKGFAYSGTGVDVVRVKKEEVNFLGYRMVREPFSIVIGKNNAILYLPNGESILFNNNEFEKILPIIESISI